MTAEAVTDNASVHVDSDVTRNTATTGCTRCDEIQRWFGITNRDGGLWQPHCRTCHRDTHFACDECQKCMPNGHRLDRRFCSSTCRQKSFLWWRSPEGLTQAAADKAYRESPEIKANRQALDAMVGAVGAAGDAADGRSRRTKSALEEHARATAETCAKCGADIAAGRIVWRLAEGYGRVHRVYPVCFACRCRTYSGGHAATHCDDCRPAGDWTRLRWSCPRAYDPKHPKVYCSGCHPRMWRDPKPCEGDCGRLVAEHREARPAYHRDEWGSYTRMTGRALVRIVCSTRCRLIVAERERVARKPEREPTTCPVCHERIDARRHDARYCSSACRQRAYRGRTAS